MDYLTQYYKNLVEHLQERLDQLTEEARLLNEIGDTPAGRKALQDYKMKATMAQFTSGRGGIESTDRYKNLANLRIKGEGNKEKMAKIKAEQEKVFDEMQAKGEITSPEHRANLERSAKGPFQDAFVARETGAVEASHPSFHARRVAGHEAHKKKIEKRK